MGCTRHLVVIFFTKVDEVFPMVFFAFKMTNEDLHACHHRRKNEEDEYFDIRLQGIMINGWVSRK